MKKIRAVQIGIGHDHATAALDSMLRNTDVFELVGLALPPSEKKTYAHKLVPYTDVRLLTPEEALSMRDIDAAVIETEEKELTKYALLAAERGLAIHMDKPGGLIYGDFERLVNTSRAKAPVLHMGYMYRYNPAVQKLFKAVKNGELGEIYAVEAQMNCLHDAKKRQWLERFPGGMMFFLGCHLIDLILRIQGQPTEVIPYNMSTGIDGVSAEDFGMVLLRYKNGISFVKTCAAEPGGFMRRQLVVCGSKGTFELDPIEQHCDGEIKDHVTLYRETYKCDETMYDWRKIGKYTVSEPYNRYDAMMRSFAEMAAGEKENEYSYDYELALYKTILAACGA